MRKRIILHIGMHKTGTSSIQQFLTDRADELQAAGVLYPQTHRPATSHDYLAWSAVGRYGKDRYPAGTLNSAWEQLLPELSKSGCETTIISSEFFWPIEESELLVLKSLTSEFDVQAIIYIRNLLGFLRSSYAQGIKNGRSVDPTSEYLREHGWRFDIPKVLDTWKTVLGPESVSVLIFDKEKHRLIQSFIETCRLSIEQPGGQDVRRNVSPSAAILRAIRFLNRSRARTSLIKKVIERLRRRLARGRASRAEVWLCKRIFGERDLFCREFVDEFTQMVGPFQSTLLSEHIPSEDHEYFSF